MSRISPRTSAPRPLAAAGLDAESAYRAFAAHDARFDGRLYIGVSSTGVYCRPVCRVRLPKPENCRYFGLAAAAEHAGFRPCLRCRPELAPGLSSVDARHHLALWAARRLEQHVADGEVVSLAHLAAEFGVSDRHLRRSFAAHWGFSPQQYLSTQRLLLAKRLLCDSLLPVTHIAQACGFGSLRAFHAAFQTHYRLNPGEIRRRSGRYGAAAWAGTDAAILQANSAAGTPTPGPGEVSAAVDDACSNGQAWLRLAFRPPYQWQGMQQQLRSSLCAGVEAADGSTWRRSLRFQHRGRRLSGWLALQWWPEAQEARVALSPDLAPAMGPLLWRLRQLLDLDTDLAQVDAALATCGVAARAPGVPVMGCLDGFEAILRILLAFADGPTPALKALLAHFGEPCPSPWPGVDRFFPDPKTLATAGVPGLEAIGLVPAVARAVVALAQALLAQQLDVSPNAEVPATLRHLHALTGMTEPALQTVAQRVLAWPDAAPGESGAQPLPHPASPWRAYAWVRQQHRAFALGDTA